MSATHVATVETVLSTGADHWMAVVSTGTSVKWYIDGTLVDTLIVSMRPFRGLSGLSTWFGNNGTAGGGTPPTMDINYARLWNTTLTLTQLSAEAASSTPVVTSGLLSNVGLTGTSDLTDTVSGHDYAVGLGAPSTASGYVRLDFCETIVQDLTFIDLSFPFTMLWHVQINGTPQADEYYDIMRAGAYSTPGDFPKPAMWVSNYTSEVFDFGFGFDFPGSADAPQLPVDPSVPCCDGGGGGGTAATGPILPYVDPAWTPSCTGSGVVPTDTDLTDDEDWRA